MPVAVDSASLYLDLMKRVLTRTGFQDGATSPWTSRYQDLRPERWHRHVLAPTQRLLARRGLQLVAVRTIDEVKTRDEGRDWPATAETMIGLKRLDNLQRCVETILADDVPGDLIETGVWRGGATIFMRAVLAAHRVTDRIVWVADSFQGLPEPDAARYPADEGDRHSIFEQLAVSAEQVRANFEKYGLFDDQVRFLEGWFADTLPTAPINQLAVARLDGDLYESTWDAINVLYPRLSPGGFLIVDDYGGIPACAKAIQDYRTEHAITEPIEQIDWTGVFWRKHS
jgi:O-methyltransferase